MNDHANAALTVRHPRYVHAAFQSYLKSQGLRAPLRKTYAAWLSRYMVFHHGQPLERLRPHHVEHYLGFLAAYADFDEQQLHEAHCCLRLFYQCFLPTLNRLDSEVQASG